MRENLQTFPVPTALPMHVQTAAIVDENARCDPGSEPVFLPCHKTKGNPNLHHDATAAAAAADDDDDDEEVAAEQTGT